MVSTVYFRYACTMSRPFHWSNSKSMRWQRWVTWFSHSSIPLRVLQPFWTAFNAWIREFSLTLQCCWIPECCTGSAQGKCLGRTSRVHTTNSESSIKIAFPSGSPDFRCSTNLTYGFFIVRLTYVRLPSFEINYSVNVTRVDFHYMVLTHMAWFYGYKPRRNWFSWFLSSESPWGNISSTLFPPFSTTRFEFCVSSSICDH